MSRHAAPLPLLPPPPTYQTRLGLLLRFVGWLLCCAGLLLLLAILGLSAYRLASQQRTTLRWTLIGFGAGWAGYGIVLLSRAWERRAGR